jgi:hypothetical protein
MKRLLILAAVATVSASAQTPKLIKPDTKNPLRKQVLDGLRPSIEKDLGQKVIFKVDIIRVYGDWAFLNVHPLQPNSKPIDFKKTKYKQALEEGAFDGSSTYALLKKSTGKWVVKTFVIGPTDVAWSVWMEEPYHAPKALFPPPFGAG